jgi:hypothetical protein
MATKKKADKKLNDFFTESDANNVCKMNEHILSLFGLRPAEAKIANLRAFELI